MSLPARPVSGRPGFSSSPGASRMRRSLPVHPRGTKGRMNGAEQSRKRLHARHSRRASEALLSGSALVELSLGLRGDEGEAFPFPGEEIGVGFDDLPAAMRNILLVPRQKVAVDVL